MYFLNELNKINILESFNTNPVNWTWTEKNDSKDAMGTITPEKYTADFSIDDHKYKVRIDTDMPVKYVPSPHTYVVVFGLLTGPNKINMDMTHAGNQYKVLSTVIDILKNFIQNNQKHIGEIHFSAEKKDFFSSDPTTDPNSFSKNRANVYARLIKENLKNLPGNWSFIQKDHEAEVQFKLIQK